MNKEFRYREIFQDYYFLKADNTDENMSNGMKYFCNLIESLFPSKGGLKQIDYYINDYDGSSSLILGCVYKSTLNSNEMFTAAIETTIKKIHAILKDCTVHNYVSEAELMPVLYRFIEESTQYLDQHKKIIQYIKNQMPEYIPKPIGNHIQHISVLGENRKKYDKLKSNLCSEVESDNEEWEEDEECEEGEQNG